MDREILDIYGDYLICSFGATTATGLSAALDGIISHDKITRKLSSAQDLDSKGYWKRIKPLVRLYERDDAAIIFDDTLGDKPYTDENELICWHYDHVQHRNIKGFNLLNCVYSTDEVTLPLGFDLVTKPILYSEIKTHKTKRKAEITKNELLRERLLICQQNQVKYRYVLTDTWFGSKENMVFIRKLLGKHFIMAMKCNRLVALSEELKKQGGFQRIDELDWSEQSPKMAWIKGLDFPVLLHRQLFTNENGSVGTLYLACSDLDLDSPKIEAIYQKRWKVEVFHKTLKSNASLEKSPTKCVRTQRNHIFMAIYATVQLECLHLKHKLNHFALRGKLYIKALQQAMNELDKLKAA